MDISSIAKLADAHRKTEEVKKLTEEIEAILEPICEEAITSGKEEDIKALLVLLPAGFHRSELRTFLNVLQDRV